MGACRTLFKRIVDRRNQPGSVMDALQQVQLRVKLRQLEQEHADLDAAIVALEHSGAGDQLQLRRLKKIKLGLKDQITTIENMLIPDIIA
jgi:hypothetical protein